MGGSQHIWGKERVIQLLMRQQRDSGTIVPSLVTFSSGALNEAMSAEGFHTTALSNVKPRAGDGPLSRLARTLADERTAVVHSHGYKANIIARALRVSGKARGLAIVSTCHGWVDSDAKLRLYNVMDRWSSFLSDATTVPNATMLAKFPGVAHTVHVPNAVPDFDGDGIENGGSVPAGERGQFVCGTLGRVSEAKGILDFLQAARTCTDPTIVFTAAGAGELVPLVEVAGPNVRFAGYFSAPEAYLAGLDVYVQASHHEGLSIALLEAMRAGKPIVATAVGGTCDAVSDDESALIIPAHSPDALREAILRLKNDPDLRERLGRNARARFVRDFHIQRQHERFAALYVRGES